MFLVITYAVNYFLGYIVFDDGEIMGYVTAPELDEMSDWLPVENMQTYCTQLMTLTAHISE